jgi:pilus assembly protein CpaF
LLTDDDVWEIMINAPDQIFVKRHEGPSGYHDEVFHDDDHVVRTLTKVLDDASSSHRKLDPSEGLQDAQARHGCSAPHRAQRRQSWWARHEVNPQVHRGAVPLARRARRARRSTARPPRSCRRASGANLSIVFAGAPGSGKTTLLSCCAAELDPTLRVVIAEEVFEADVPLANVASMQARPGPIGCRSTCAGWCRVPAHGSRHRHRRRGPRPRRLLLTLPSGAGFTTIHAGWPPGATALICQLADAGNELPMSALNTLVSEAIDIVVHCRRGPDGPRVTEVVAVEDLSAAPDSTQFTITEVFRRRGYDHPLEWTGSVPVRPGRSFDAADWTCTRCTKAAATGGRSDGRRARCAGRRRHLLPVHQYRCGGGLGFDHRCELRRDRRAVPAWLAQSGLGDVALSSSLPWSPRSSRAGPSSGSSCSAVWWRLSWWPASPAPSRSPGTASGAGPGWSRPRRPGRA